MYGNIRDTAAGYRSDWPARNPGIVGASERDDRARDFGRSGVERRMFRASADDGLAPDGGIVRHGVSGAPACRPPRVSHAPPTLTRPKAWTRLNRLGLGGSGRPSADEKNWGHMMPLHVGKFERFPSADRNELALAALEWCRAARASAGVKDSRFYWIDPNEIVVVTDAEPGAWGPGAGAEVSPQAAKAIFALADLAFAFNIWRARFHTRNVRLLKLKLGRIFDRYHAFLVTDRSRQRIEQRCLTGACTT